MVGRAIQEDADAGVTVLRLGFSLSRTGRRPAPAAGTREADSVKADAAKLSLRATLHYLWEEAGFNRWTERMTGKRNWFIIRKHLLHAAENKTAKGAPLSEVLYIPEVFSTERKMELAQRHLSAISRISSHQRRPAPAHAAHRRGQGVCGRTGHKLVVKHLPDHPFLLSEDLHRRMTARFEREITLWDAVPGAHLIVIATFGVAPNGVTAVEELALMVVTETWIPIEHIYDANLVTPSPTNDVGSSKRSATISPHRDRWQRRSSWIPSPPPSPFTSFRRKQNRRAWARSSPSSPRVPSPLGFGRQARAPCRRFPSEAVEGRSPMIGGSRP